MEGEPTKALGTENDCDAPLARSPSTNRVESAASETCAACRDPLRTVRMTSTTERWLRWAAGASGSHPVDTMAPNNRLHNASRLRFPEQIDTFSSVGR